MQPTVRWLTKTEDGVTEDEVVDYGSNWHDRLICQVIRREAEALIRGETRTSEE